MEIAITDWPTDYLKLCWRLVIEGRERSPRGKPTWELPNVSLVFPGEHDPDKLLPVGVNRRVNLAIAAVEALQLCAGLALPDLTVAVSENFKPYREPGGRFWGAYGDRVNVNYGQTIQHDEPQEERSAADAPLHWAQELVHQAELTRRKLEVDEDTRQAVITLWNPKLDNDPGKFDYPCTISLVFTLVDRDQLELTTFMRSNDAWLGLPYDVFQFTQLQRTVANLLGVFPSTYTHHAVSLHLYQSDVNHVRRLEIDEDHVAEWLPRGLGQNGQTFEQVRNAAELLILADRERVTDELTTHENWYRAQLLPYLGLEGQEPG